MWIDLLERISVILRESLHKFTAYRLMDKTYGQG
jgi:hypothetical protein